MISRALAFTIAKLNAPPHLREDAAQEAMIASWQAEQKGQPESLAAKRQIIDFIRSETKGRSHCPPQFVTLDVLPDRKGPSSVPSLEAAIQYLYGQGMSIEQVGKAMGRKESFVRYWMARLGIQKRRRGPVQAKACFCGNKAFKKRYATRKHVSGGRCRFHYLLAEAQAAQRLRDRKRARIHG